MTNALAQQTAAGALAISDAEALEMFGDSSLDSNLKLSFNVIKIMRESAQFEVSKDDYAKTLQGHILHIHNANQWWEVSYDDRGEGDSPVPNCYSVDGIKPCGGDKQQAQLCSACALNKFGSGKNEKGKACRNTMRFVFLIDGAVLPVIITAPPTSLGKKSSVQAWLNAVPNSVSAAYTALNIRTKNNGPIVDYWPAHVELSLRKEKFDSGEASILEIKTLDVVVPNTPEASGTLKYLFGTVKKAKETYANEVVAYVENEQVEEPVTTAQDGLPKENAPDCPI
jgi:hypothetical protein